MSKILSVKTAPNQKAILTIEVSEKELLWLKGNIEKIHIFSENNLENIARLVQRGKREATKYFLLPREFRNGILTSNSIRCTQIEKNNKCFFIFEVKKF